MANPVVLGIECKAYFLSSGTRASWGTLTNGITSGAAPANLTEMTVVKNATVTLAGSEADVSSRASLYKLIRRALRDLSVEIDIPWKPTDASFSAMLQAYMTNTSIAVALLDGDKVTANSQGPWADWEVTEFTRTEDIEQAAVAKVKLQPTSSAVAPEWVKVA